MKQCPRCHKAYSDDQLNFCLDDGELLSAVLPERPQSRYADDSPPTLLINDSRTTNPYELPRTQAPMQQWQQPQAQNVPYQPYSMMRNRVSADQTIPTIAIILGVLSLPLVCCYGGIWLGVPAAVLGYIGMRNADSDGTKYGGRGMAIGGLVLGIISFLSTLGFILMMIVGNVS